MQNDPHRRKRLLGWLFPLLLLLPFPIYVLMIWVGSLPTNVIFERGLDDLYAFSPGICSLLGVVFGILGVAAAITNETMPKWRKIPSIILGGIHLAIGIAIPILIFLFIILGIIGVAFFGVTV